MSVAPEIARSLGSARQDSACGHSAHAIVASAGSHVVDASPVPDVSHSVADTSPALTACKRETLAMSFARRVGARPPIEQGSAAKVATLRGESASRASPRKGSLAIDITLASLGRTMWKRQRVESQVRGDGECASEIFSPADVSLALSVVSHPTTATVSPVCTIWKSEYVDTTSGHDAHQTLEMGRGGPTTPQVDSRVATVPPTSDVPREASVTSAEISAPVSYGHWRFRDACRSESAGRY